MSASPGWYLAQGDPEDTLRWWDGSQWVGLPRPAADVRGTPGPGSLLDSQPTSLAGSQAELTRPWPATSLESGPSAASPASRTTGDPAVHGVPLATIGRRVGASILDSIFGLVCMIPLFVSLISNLDFDAIADGAEPVIKISTPALVASGALLLAYSVVPVAVFGATLGRSMLSLRIIRASDGRRPDFGTALLRALGPTVVSVIGFLSIRGSQDGQSVLSQAGLLYSLASFLAAVTDSALRRSLNDRIARTYVVRRG